MNNISIIGSGSYSTGIIKILSENKIAGIGNIGDINWYIRNPQVIQHIEKFHHNPDYLSSVELHHQQFMMKNSIHEAVEDSKWILLGVPSAFVHTVLSQLKPLQLKDKKIITVVKGIIPEYNQIPADYLNSLFQIPFENICMITGPSHAEEIALEKLTYLTFASSPIDLAQEICQSFGNHYIKTTTSNDLIGAEYAAVLKNVFSLAAGIYHGLGYGDNFHAFLITNALKEIKRFVNAVSNIDRDIEDAAYLGDLLATSYSSFSRNRTMGNFIGKGYTVAAAKAEMNMVAEGYHATRCMVEINKKYSIDLPILDAVFQILYNNGNASEIMSDLTNKLN